jgi:Flp pilus assembly secretin CpaC
MQTSSSKRRALRRTELPRRATHAMIVGAAAFVAATAFSALSPLPVRADEAGASTGSTPNIVLTQRTVMNLQIGKVLPLAFPEGAEYSLTDTDGKLLSGSALTLPQDSQNHLVRIRVQDGLLFLEAQNDGRAFLSINTPRQIPQHFVLHIGADKPMGVIAPSLELTEETPEHNVVVQKNAARKNAKASAPKSTSARRPPSLSIATRTTKTTTIALPVFAAPPPRIAVLDSGLSHLLVSDLPETLRPVAARTVTSAQVSPIATDRTPVVPPLPVLETTDTDTRVPGTPISSSTIPAAAGSTPSANIGDANIGNEETGDASLPQVSPNVPAPMNLPAMRIPFQTKSELPEDIKRAVNDPIANRPRLTVSQGMARILAFKQNILAVFFSDENVMDARAINARTLAVTGKGAGKSTMAVMLARSPDDVVGRALIYNVDVFSSSPEAPPEVPIGFTDPVAARQAIETAIDDPRVAVSVIQRPDGALVARLTGTLRDKNEIDAVTSVAALFVPNVISSLYASTGAIPLADALGTSRFSSEGILQGKLRTILNNDTIVITSLPGGTTLTATVDSAGEAEAILGILPYLDRKIQPIIVLRGAPAASKFYNSERPLLFGEDYEITSKLKEVTGLDSVYVVRTARNALAIYGTVRDRAEYDTLRRYALMMPQLQEAAASSQTQTTNANPNLPGAPGTTTQTSASVTSSVSGAPVALSAAAGTAPVESTSGLTGLRQSNMPVSGYQFPTQIQMFVRILDENAAAVRLVTVESSVVEIRRDALRDLGVQFGSATLTDEDITPATPGTTNIAPDGTITSTPGTPGRVEREIDPTFVAGSTLLGNSFGGFGGLSAINPFRARVSALYQKGAARVLSNPNLTTIEGSEAQITIGGSRPVPSTTTTAAAGGSNQTSVEFRRYGIILTMRPTVADDDTIVLQVRGDVTDLDYTTAINLGGAEIPGERVRSVNTTVTMREGDTLVLGGLITNDRRKQTSKVPFLGDLPIIGKLFQSKRFENNETELAIFLTPSIRRMNGSQNLREIVQAAPGFPELPGLQEDNNAFGLSTIGQ